MVLGGEVAGARGHSEVAIMKQADSGQKQDPAIKPQGLAPGRLHLLPVPQSPKQGHQQQTKRYKYEKQGHFTSKPTLQFRTDLIKHGPSSCHTGTPK